MDVDFAILGLLSWQPLSGYDLMKLYADIPGCYWSGNNMLIFTALVKRAGLGARGASGLETF